MPKRIAKVIEEKYILKEPIYRRQKEESDVEYNLFLTYRDLPWDQRSLRRATAIATNVHLNTVEAPHSQMIKASNRWNWVRRVDAYDLFIQEYSSERQEKILLHTKSQIEHTVMRLVTKINRIENIATAEELKEPEMIRDMAVLQAMIDKGGAGKFLLDAYKTLFGQKVSVGQPKMLKNISELEWNALDVA
jgi:hypothetical protein